MRRKKIDWFFYVSVAIISLMLMTLAFEFTFEVPEPDAYSEGNHSIELIKDQKARTAMWKSWAVLQDTIGRLESSYEKVNKANEALKQKQFAEDVARRVARIDFGHTIYISSGVAPVHSETYAEGYKAGQAFAIRSICEGWARLPRGCKERK